MVYKNKKANVENIISTIESYTNKNVRNVNYNNRHNKYSNSNFTRDKYSSISNNSAYGINKRSKYKKLHKVHDNFDNNTKKKYNNPSLFSDNKIKYSISKNISQYNNSDEQKAKQERKLLNLINAEVDQEELRVGIYKEIIVRINTSDGKITLNSGGYRTKTTLNAINFVLQPLGMRIKVLEDNTWQFTEKPAYTQNFEDNMIIEQTNNNLRVKVITRASVVIQYLKQKFSAVNKNIKYITNNEDMVP